MKPMACLMAVLAMPGMVAAQDTVEVGTGAVLRGLDKLDGEVGDFEIANGAAGSVGRLRVELGEWRYPQGDPAADPEAVAQEPVAEDRWGFSFGMVDGNAASLPAGSAEEGAWPLQPA